MDKNENKEIDQNITIEGQRFVYIKDRLIGGKVFVSEDRSAYLRISGTAEIVYLQPSSNLFYRKLLKKSNSLRPAAVP